MMTLIQSVSGMRGTLGGKPGECLTPVDIIKFTGAFGMWLKKQNAGQKIRVVTGRDARISGYMVSMIVAGTLVGMGIDVVDAGVTTTPTVAMGVLSHHAHGGIVMTASHNPGNWNALKFLDHLGEFLKEDQAAELKRLMVPDDFEFAAVGHLGKYAFDEGMLAMHIQKILELPLVDAGAIQASDFRIAVDGINSSGGIAVPILLKALGIKKIDEIYCEPSGVFSHNPEPLPEHLSELSELVVRYGAQIGFAVHPDVDRLVIIDENGDCFGEEYTLVAVADYVLSQTPGNTVSNMSSTRALQDITLSYGQQYFPAAVGEANVVEVMKRHHAVIGGEGNGGVIYPPLHHGRDALVGIALFLTHLAKSGKSCSRLKMNYPRYHISKKRVGLPAGTDMQFLLDKLQLKYSNQPSDTTDGLKIWFENDWVHLRKSNTEPIIRIYSESSDEFVAGQVGEKIMNDLKELLNDRLD